MRTEHTFARDETFPSWWANAAGKFLSRAAFGFQLIQQDATHVKVPAGADDAAAAIAVEGRWRWQEADVVVAHPGGAAGEYDIYVTAKETDIEASPDPYTDATDYSFGMQVVASGATPAIVAGVVDLILLVGHCEWDGAAITRVDQLVPEVPTHAHRHATGGPDSLAPADIGAATAAALTAETARAEAAEATALTNGSAASLASLTVSGSVTGRAGLSLDAGSGTAGQTLTLTGRAAGVGVSSTVSVSSAGALTLTSGTSVLTGAASGGTAFSASATSFNIPGGSQYQVGGAQISLSNLSNATTGSGTTVVLSASPTLTGTPLAATAPVDTNTTQLATTQFVLGQAAAANPAMNGAVAVGVSTRYARADHVHPSDTSRAALTTNTFSGLQTLQAGLSLDAGAGTVAQTVTLTGRNGGTAASATLAVSTVGTLTRNVPAGQTHVWQINAAAVGTLSSTALNLAAGMQYQVNGAQISTANLSDGVTGTGAIVLASSPTLTGVPLVPTAAPGTNTQQAASCAFVLANGGGGKAWFGDGSDGAFTADGVAAMPGASLSGSTYTLTRDCWFTNLTINTGVTVITSGYRIFGTGTLTINGTGTIHNNGSAGVSTTGGAGGLSGFFNGGGAGASATGAGGSPGNVAMGGTGGAGGSSAAGNLTLPTGGVSRTPFVFLSGDLPRGAGGTQVDTTIGGGSGGGGASSSSGGGGAGVVALAFRIAIVNNGTISANGGAAGGTNGGGGGGGVVFTLTGSYTGNVPTVTGGAKTGTGTAGNNGTLVQLNP